MMSVGSYQEMEKLTDGVGGRDGGGREGGGDGGGVAISSLSLLEIKMLSMSGV